MAEYDDRTLHLTATRPTAANIAIARRELLRRPARTVAELRGGLGDGALAVLRVRGLYPSLHGIPDPVLLAAAHPRRPGACGWCEVRLDARVHGRRRPAFTADAVALLGQPCGSCRPKPKPAAPARTSTRTRARASTSTRARARAARSPAASGPGRTYADWTRTGGGSWWDGFVASGYVPPRACVPDTPANRQAARRLGLTPAVIGWSSTR
jgi:hypothetical protein